MGEAPVSAASYRIVKRRLAVCMVADCRRGGNQAGLCGTHGSAYTKEGKPLGLPKGVWLPPARPHARVQRRGPLHPVVHNALDVWLTARKDQPAGANAAVFLNRRGDRLSTRGAYNAFATIAEAADIAAGRDAELTPPSSATTMTRAGADIIIAAEILRHETLS